MKVLFVLLYPVSPAVFGDFTDILPEGDREPSPASSLVSSHYEPLFTLHHGIDKDDTSFHPSPPLIRASRIHSFTPDTIIRHSEGENAPAKALFLFSGTGCVVTFFCSWICIG